MSKMCTQKWLVCLSLSSILFLGACQKEEESTHQPLDEALEQLKDSGDIIKMAHANDLIGADQNKNGIRDDVDQYIAHLDISKPQQQAVKQSARALGAILKEDLNNQQTIHRIKQELSQATQNMSVEFMQTTVAQQVFSSLEQQVLNTPKRQEKYQQYKNLSAKK
ncbi:hypothetical protein [Neisseria sp. Ec49-e6-T10]|uniref:hypothetical protein n=1 Tax=Neisseria sp. Ec49-e6-T10 TaxID=3140744 RepID=UPI003EB77978